MLLIYNPPSGASWKTIPMPARFSLFFFFASKVPVYRHEDGERGRGGREREGAKNRERAIEAAYFFSRH
jgi:hypothetical protein